MISREQAVALSASALRKSCQDDLRRRYALSE